MNFQNHPTITITGGDAIASTTQRSPVRNAESVDVYAVLQETHLHLIWSHTKQSAPGLIHFSLRAHLGEYATKRELVKALQFQVPTWWSTALLNQLTAKPLKPFPPRPR